MKKRILFIGLLGTLPGSAIDLQFDHSKTPTQAPTQGTWEFGIGAGYDQFFWDEFNPIDNSSFDHESGPLYGIEFNTSWSKSPFKAELAASYYLGRPNYYGNDQQIVNGNIILTPATGNSLYQLFKLSFSADVKIAQQNAFEIWFGTGLEWNTWSRTVSSTGWSVNNFGSDGYVEDWTTLQVPIALKLKLPGFRTQDRWSIAANLMIPAWNNQEMPYGPLSDPNVDTIMYMNAGYIIQKPKMQMGYRFDLEYRIEHFAFRGQLNLLNYLASAEGTAYWNSGSPYPNQQYPSQTNQPESHSYHTTFEGLWYF